MSPLARPAPEPLFLLAMLMRDAALPQAPDVPSRWSGGSALPPLTLAPAQVLRGWGVLSQSGAALARLGSRAIVVGGARALALGVPRLELLWAAEGMTSQVEPVQECSEATLAHLRAVAIAAGSQVVIGIGGGKALDTAKLLAHQLQVPIATLPTTAATCAAWSALSNVYSEQGAFLYDVTLDRCPDLLILDYELVATAPPRTLAAGVGDAIAKWYEASISSGSSQQSVIIAAVQQARVLRDWLLQQAATAINQPHHPLWQETVDATVLLAGTIGGLGGAACRTVAAHAIHNGLTHLPASHGTLHGEKVALGILAQLRLEELVQGSQLAAAARAELLGFYARLGLPKSLAELGLGTLSASELEEVAQVACDERSDIHHLPFAVSPAQVIAALVSTDAPPGGGSSDSVSQALGRNLAVHASPEVNA